MHLEAHYQVTTNMRSLLLVPILFSLNIPFAKSAFSNDGYFEIEKNEQEENVLVKVKENEIYSEELRVYFDEETPISEIKEGAFDACPLLNTVMLSCYIPVVPQNLFSNVPSLRTINYTGTEEQFNILGLNVSGITVNYYACDEGFINYWFNEIRVTEQTNICDISDETYREMLAKYSALDDSERSVVNEFQDGETTIFDSIQYLKSTKNKTTPQTNNPDVNKSTMIAFILIIASIGLSFICVFYLLKERKVIK